MENLCNICPRKCNINRINNIGFCKATNKIKISLYKLFNFEEPIISGNSNNGGSGAIFFSNCNLKCCYCQNSIISFDGKGEEISTARLAEIFKELEQMGAYNINLVTPTHYTNEIIEALSIYKPKIPIVWNTSGYESVETIEKLKNFVDIFLTDFKYFDNSFSQKYSNAKNYPENAKRSILKMREIQPLDIIENGLMKKGLIIRHLVLPNLTKDSLKIIDWVNENLGNKTYFSLMSQYVPMANASKFPEINRKIKPVEYKILINHLEKLDFKNVFLQDFDSADENYTPDF